MGDTGSRQPHFDAGKRAQQNEIVALAEMPYTKHLAGKFGKTRAKRHIEVVENNLAKLIGVMARRHQHGGHHW
jgi:hypothetical protein